MWVSHTFDFFCGCFQHHIFVGCEIERRPRGASRGKPAPTFVSGQLCLQERRATALFVRLGIEPCARAIAHLRHGTDWPETNVGAGLPREAPRGRRSIYAPLQNPRRSPGSPHPTSTITQYRVKRRTRTGSATSSICKMRSLSSSGYDPEMRKSATRSLHPSCPWR